MYVYIIYEFLQFSHKIISFPKYTFYLFDAVIPRGITEKKKKVKRNETKKIKRYRESFERGSARRHICVSSSCVTRVNGGRASRIFSLYVLVIYDAECAYISIRSVFEKRARARKKKKLTRVFRARTDPFDAFQKRRVCSLQWR